MEDVISRIPKILNSARDTAEKIQNASDIERFESEFFGKKSALSVLSKQLKELPADQKKEAGKAVGALRQQLTDLSLQKKKELAGAMQKQKWESEWIDVTKPAPANCGSLHPISRVQERVEEIFQSMGFAVADGNHIENEWYNFDALNIPASHPARDMQDTFWIQRKGDNPNKNFVLRTQTSDVQIHTMQEQGAPLRVIAPGRVFRNEDVDASHDAVFYQVEGLLVDEDISLAHLKGTIETMLGHLFETDTCIRFRPGYFPFVEPGLEVDFQCTLCRGKGCKTCKQTGWIEFMGAGMVHRNVLKNAGVDPEKFSGFAFGFGLTRLAMMKFGIDDIRLLSSQKIDFLSQF
ncbi:MAG: phenylalanine--tRNA ligase subunit alpha [Candidatus Gracilibacteria bacterium]|nr:phenylalanine--tRNA ligase subunit alpha [Candidatus Gracilibacteria bacterium]